jgi:hypothetical protein
MAKMSVVEKYKSMHFAVPEGASPDDFNSNHRISMSLALDMSAIRSETSSPNMFHNVCMLYYKDRKQMIVPNEDGSKNDAVLESHRMTIITICGEALVEACELLNMEYADTNLKIQTHYMNDGKDVGAAVSLGIRKDVPEHKKQAMNIIFDEFQTKLGKVGVAIQDSKPIEDADYKDMEVDDITAKA